MHANLTRRDMVKLAAALGAARAPLPALTPAQAAARLAAPASAPLPSAETGPALLDPARFAAAAHPWLGSAFEDLVGLVAPAEHAAYARARAALVRRLRNDEEEHAGNEREPAGPDPRAGRGRHRQSADREHPPQP